MKTLKDFNFKNKKVLVRCDFQVPFSNQGDILDDFRIRQTIPTIKYLIRNAAKIILISHWKPEGTNEPRSLRPISSKIEELLRKKVEFLEDCLGGKVEEKIEKMKQGDVILLENLRFYKEEEENDSDFAQKLAKLADIYINEAFSVCHRGHASIVGIPKYLPSAAGFLLEEEIKNLKKVLEKPLRPLVAIIGGVKIKTKIKVIENFLEKADHLLLGGEIANAILATKGILIGKPLPAPEIVKEIEEIDLTNSKLHLPVDGVISLLDIKTGLEEGYLREGALGTVKKEEKVFDIGHETIKIFSEIIKEAKMILWAGPLGLYEEKKFEKGTKEAAESIVKNKEAFKIIGGGDTIAAMDKFGLLGRFDHVCTGGGAMLEFLSGEKLPGIIALK